MNFTPSLHTRSPNMENSFTVPSLPWTRTHITALMPLVKAVQEGNLLEIYDPLYHSWKDAVGILQAGNTYRIKKVPTVVWGVWIDKPNGGARHMCVCTTEARAKQLAESQWKGKNPIIVKLEEPGA